MKKRILIFLSVLAVVLTLIALMVMTASAEDNPKTITISYMEAYEPSSGTTTLDKVAYSGGKQTVGVGEEFTLPTTANISFVGQEGYQLRWYTSDGRSYKGGDKVSFTKDTKLFRVVAKEVYSIDELNSAMSSNSHAAVLMTDINAGNAYINVWDQNYAILDLNGYSINIQKNGTIMGGQRSAKVIIGKGTLKVTNPDNKVGQYALFECKGHGYNGDRNKTIIGKDVIVDAPNFYLCTDGEGGGATGYPLVRIYGTINVYYVLARWGNGNPGAKVEFYDGCNVTIGAPFLNVDYKVPGTDIYNKQSIEVRIYGGTFNLPAAAANKSFWSNDTVANKDELTNENVDIIKIEGGTFILPDGATPAIADYLTEDYVGAVASFYDFVKNNRGNASFELIYRGIRNAYIFKFYSDGKLEVTDNMGTGIAGTYYCNYTRKSDNSGLDGLEVFENSEKTIPLSKFSLKLGVHGGFAIATDEMKKDYALQTMVVNGINYHVVVTAKCGENDSHSFNSTEDATVEANCQHTAYANYVCSGCGYSAYFNWGEKEACSFSVTSETPATATTLGNKVFACSSCGESKSYPYTIDPTALEVTVKIRKDDDTFETITVLASEIFAFDKSGIEGAYVYSVSKILEFGGYKVRNIYGITIPVGIMYVKITSQNYEKYQNVEYGVTELTVPDGANVSFGNLGNLRRLKKITIGEANVSFGRSCSYYNPNNEKRNMQLIETIDASTPGANVYFDEYSFEGRTTLKNIILTDNSTYTIRAGAFKNAGVENIYFSASSKIEVYGESFYGTPIGQVIIPDNGNIVLYDSPFRECKATYLYIGKNFLITSTAFSDMKLLEKVVIMDGVKLDNYRENLFSNAGSSDFATPLYVFNHSVDFKDLPKQTFNNCDGIFYYTVADIGTRTDIFNNCAAVSITDESGNTISYPKWTIVTGIPHPVISKTINPQCEESGYQTWISEICPCGTHLTETATAKKYVDVYKLSTQTPVETNEYAVVEIPALGHATDGQKVNIAYLTGYMGVGNTTYICTRCEKEHTVEGDAKALFVFHGYSVREDGTAFCVDYGINVKAVNEYAKANNLEIGVGMFAVASEKLGNMTPGEAISSGSVPVINSAIDLGNNKLGSVTLKIRGFNTDELKAIGLVMTAYMSVTDGNGTNTYYFQSEQCENPSSYSMAQYLIDIVA